MVATNAASASGGNHPLLLAMRLENVFSVRRSCLSLARSTMAVRSTFSSSRRRLHLGKPAGAGERVSAISFVFRRAVEIRRRAEFESYLRAEHRLEPFLEQLAPGPLDSGDAGVQCAAIRLSLQPSPASDTVRLQEDARLRQYWAERLPLRIKSSVHRVPPRRA